MPTPTSHQGARDISRPVAGRARSAPTLLLGAGPQLLLGLGHHLGPHGPGLAAPGDRARSLLPPDRRLGDARHPVPEAGPGGARDGLAERRPPPGLLFHSDRGGQLSPPRSKSCSMPTGASPARVDRVPAWTTRWPRASSTVSRPNSPTTIATARGTRRGWPSSITSRPSTTGSAGTPESGITHPRSTRPRTLSLNPASTFLGQDQSAACAG